MATATFVISDKPPLATSTPAESMDSTLCCTPRKRLRDSDSFSPTSSKKTKESSNNHSDADASVNNHNAAVPSEDGNISPSQSTEGDDIFKTQRRRQRKKKAPIANSDAEQALPQPQSKVSQPVKTGPPRHTKSKKVTPSLPPTFAQYPVILTNAATGPAMFSKLGPSLQCRVLVDAVGQIEGVRPLPSGKFLIACCNEKQQHKLANLTSLAQVQIRCTIPEATTEGVIRPIPLSEDLDKLQQSLEKVKSLQRLKNQKGELTQAVKITFLKKTLPDTVKIVKTFFAVEPYVAPVRRCTKCQRLGHGSKQCKARQDKCPRCGQKKDHPVDNCPNDKHCLNCGGPHSAAYLGCPELVLRRTANKIRAAKYIPYAEAIRRAKFEIMKKQKKDPDTSNDSDSEVDECWVLKMAGGKSAPRGASKAKRNLATSPAFVAEIEKQDYSTIWPEPTTSRIRTGNQGGPSNPRSENPISEQNIALQRPGQRTDINPINNESTVAQKLKSTHNVKKAPTKAADKTKTNKQPTTNNEKKVADAESQTSPTHDYDDLFMDEPKLMIVEEDETQNTPKPQSEDCLRQHILKESYAKMKMMSAENCGEVFKFVTGILAALIEAKTNESPENVLTLLTGLYTEIFKPKENPTPPALNKILTTQCALLGIQGGRSVTESQPLDNTMT